MSTVVTTVNTINTQTLQYAPLVIAGVQAAEISAANGADKKQAVLNGIVMAAKIGEATPNVNVAAISSMIDLFVSIFNALGVFKH